MQMSQRLDCEKIERKPDRSAPVRIAAEQSGPRFARLIVKTSDLSVHVDDKRMFAVVARQRSQPVRRQKFRLVEHTREKLLHARLAHQRDQPREFVGRRLVQEFCKARLVLDVPARALAEHRQSFPQGRIELYGRKDWQQSYHGTRAHRESRAVALAKPIVEKAVLVVPEPAHGGRDQSEMLEELYREIFVARLMVGKQQSHLQHVETELGHPGSAIRLLQYVAVGEHPRAVERADIVKTKKAALEHVVAICVFSIYPPSEVDQELLKSARQKIVIGAAIDPKHRERGPRLNWRIHVSEIPFIRGQLAVRVHVPFARQQQQLMLRC